MAAWDDALGRIQPHIPGAPRAGSPGMGAGPVPYAPGATQYAPNTAPPRANVQPAQDLPVTANGRPPAAPQAAPSQGQGSGQIDPMTSVYYMQKLMEWFMNGRSRIQR